MKHSIHTEITINAPVSTVWKTLVTFSEYKHWNPFIPFAEGQPIENSMVNIRIKRIGANEQPYKVKILEVTENKKLSWLGHFLITGLCDGEHSFELEAIGENQTKLLHYEHFKGLLVPFVLKNFDANFIALNKSLKEYVEKSSPSNKEA